MKLLLALVLSLLLCGCAAKKNAASPGAAPAIPAIDAKWTEVSTPFRAANITANGNVFWICGANEMIASSGDGGKTWRLVHQNRGGEVLLNIAFVNERVGHAAGTGGILLLTSDGGKTWKERHASGTIRAFSFADTDDGIAFIGGRFQHPPFSAAVLVNGSVSLTHDGGAHWENVVALNSDDLRPFTELLSIAALDRSHYLMLRRQPEIEDAFVITQDGGQSWRLAHVRNDATNRELPRTVFTHAGEYWSFGMELVNRKVGGGYGVPLNLHSRDGANWSHGAIGPSEHGGCNPFGCVLYDGTIESLYGEHAKFWAVPQDGSLSDKWAIAGNYACTLGLTVQCGFASITDQPQPRPTLHGPQRAKDSSAIANLQFADDCIGCGVRVIKLSPGLRWSGQIMANFKLGNNGTVADLSLDGVPSDQLRDEIARQLRSWLFEALPKEQAESLSRRSVAIRIECLDAPNAPGIDGCRLLRTQ